MSPETIDAGLYGVAVGSVIGLVSALARALWRNRIDRKALTVDVGLHASRTISTAEAMADYQAAANRLAGWEEYDVQPYSGFLVARPHPVLLLRNRRRVRVPLRLIRR